MSLHFCRPRCHLNVPPYTNWYYHQHEGTMKSAMRLDFYITMRSTGACWPNCEVSGLCSLKLIIEMLMHLKNWHHIQPLEMIGNVNVISNITMSVWLVTSLMCYGLYHKEWHTPSDMYPLTQCGIREIYWRLNLAWKRFIEEKPTPMCRIPSDPSCCNSWFQTCLPMCSSSIPIRA